jgi:hypothetical protein
LTHVFDAILVNWDFIPILAHFFVMANEVVELSLDELYNFRLLNPLGDFALGFGVIVDSRIIIEVHLVLNFFRPVLSVPFQSHLSTNMII